MATQNDSITKGTAARARFLAAAAARAYSNEKLAWLEAVKS